MASTPVYYGSFNLNDNNNYFVTEKPMSMVPTKAALLKIARLEGMKKTGAVVNERQLSFKLKVVSTISRSNLETLLDNLYGALAYQQQRLQMHAVDNRYFICDCIDAQTTLSPGKIQSADVSLTFLAQQPYALAASASSYTTTLSGWVNNSGLYYAFFNVAAGGNIFCRPTITLTNLSNVAWNGFSMQQNTNNTNIEVDSGLPTTTNDYLTINCDPTTNSGYKVSLNGGSPLAFLGEFTVLEPISTNFGVYIRTNSQPNVRVNVTWTARWLS